MLASYDFEQPSPSGPDTFWLRARSGSQVDLSTAFRVSGERSLHLHEEPGNRDFSEFLGYFPTRADGSVFVQFYVLFTDLDQKFNFGLAGPGWFLNPQQHGQAIWLETRQGSLWHRPANVWQEIFVPAPFSWYFVDLVYRVDHGTYDLRIYEEACGARCQQPVVDLRDQRNTANADDSSVRYFSFIGDLEDEGRFDYFVDDVLVASNPDVRQRPFVAPGRRRLFVESLGAAGVEVTDAAYLALTDEAWQWLRPSTDSAEESAGQDPQADQLGGEAANASGSAILARAHDRFERTGDLALGRGDWRLAEAIFERLYADLHRRARIQLKQADLAHLRGDVASEIALREAIYGRLDLEEHADR